MVTVMHRNTNNGLNLGKKARLAANCFAVALQQAVK